MSKITETSAEQTWIDICNKQNWDDESQILHLEGFLRTKGLFRQFAQYAEKAQQEESEGTSSVVTFEATGFTNSRKLIGQELTPAQVKKFNKQLELPEGVQGVVRGYITDDDGQGSKDIHVFVSVTLLVASAIDFEVGQLPIPGDMLSTIAYQMSKGFDLDLEESSWEIVEVSDE